MTQVRTPRWESTVSPRFSDVLLGRGRGRRQWGGNQFFDLVIHHNALRYDAAETRHDKTIIVQEIIESVQKFGCRFLDQDPTSAGKHGRRYHHCHHIQSHWDADAFTDGSSITDNWYLASNLKIQKRVGHALRYQLEKMKHKSHDMNQTKCVETTQSGRNNCAENLATHAGVNVLTTPWQPQSHACGASWETKSAAARYPEPRTGWYQNAVAQIDMGATSEHLSSTVIPLQNVVANKEDAKVIRQRPSPLDNHHENSQFKHQQQPPSGFATMDDNLRELLSSGYCSSSSTTTTNNNDACGDTANVFPQQQQHYHQHHQSKNILASEEMGYASLSFSAPVVTALEDSMLSDVMDRSTTINRERTNSFSYGRITAGECGYVKNSYVDDDCLHSRNSITGTSSSNCSNAHFNISRPALTNAAVEQKQKEEEVLETMATRAKFEQSLQPCSLSESDLFTDHEMLSFLGFYK